MCLQNILLKWPTKKLHYQCEREREWEISTLIMKSQVFVSEWSVEIGITLTIFKFKLILFNSLFDHFVRHSQSARTVHFSKHAQREKENWMFFVCSTIWNWIMMQPKVMLSLSIDRQHSNWPLYGCGFCTKQIFEIVIRIRFESYTSNYV